MIIIWSRGGHLCVGPPLYHIKNTPISLPNKFKHVGKVGKVGEKAMKLFKKYSVKPFPNDF